MASDAAGPRDAIDLARLEEHLAERRERLSSDAARWIGHHLAALFAEAHAHVDDDGAPAPILRGDLPAEAVRIDREGAVTLGPSATNGPLAPEVAAGGRLTPRADIHALGMLLRGLLDDVEDDEIASALATATEAAVARRRITSVELEALLARGADLTEGRRALAEAVRLALDDDGPDVAVPSSRPIPPAARVGVALFTAAAVFAVGVAVAERWRP